MKVRDGTKEMPALESDVGSLQPGVTFRCGATWAGGGSRLMMKLGPSDGGDRNREPPPKRGTESLPFGLVMDLEDEELYIADRSNPVTIYRIEIVDLGPVRISET
jgi:hypothetical protein